MRKWWPLAAICLGTFMLLLDVTIVTVALPAMATDLGTSLSELEWVVDIYALALASLLLGVGSRADRIGRRKVYLVGLIVFTAASVVCAVAPNAGVLIGARAVQGLGAAGMFGTTIALLGMHYSGRERGVAFAVWGATNSVAAAAGPMVGGVLTQYLDWRWIFFVNLPVCLAAVVLTLRSVREAKGQGPQRADVLGMVTFTVASGALTFGLIRAHSDGWAAPLTLGLFAAAAVALTLFVVVERRVEHPVLDLSLFRSPSFTGIMISALFLQGAAFASLLFESLWMQSVLGYEPVEAGLYILPMCASAFVVSALAGRFGPWPPRATIGGGLALIALGSGMQASLDAGSTGSSLVAGLVVSGLGVGLVTPSLSAAALATVPPERGGMVGGAVNTFRQLGFALGIAVFGVIFQARIESVLKAGGSVPDPHEAAVALSGGQARSIVAGWPEGERAGMAHLVREAFASGLNAVLVVAAALGAVASLLVVSTVRVPTGGAEQQRPEAGTSPRGQETRADAAL
ncbi:MULTISPECIES: MFS transporter [unclassified Streptomyces]|uniref:MFS transporter n=1 Tax=unclassified Streptomyces TaxID=2593676 RepID=UPI0006FADD62|nr:MULTISPECIES: MFS transporter [unclassified Streptomyces]KQX46285.1 multidrug MFS transporter [Streptomyces sp. Root1304]KRA81070.1 multidrug MFS transporter [Streptomyces sp. Root66D1]